MKYRVWSLTIDSESWLGTELYASEAAAWAGLCSGQSEWLWNTSPERWDEIQKRLPDDLTDDDREFIRDALGDYGVFFTIRSHGIDTNKLEEAD